MSTRILHKTAYTLLTAGLMSSSFAVGPGFYMGFLFGPSDVNKNNVSLISQANSSQRVVGSPKTRNNYAAGFFMGNKLNPYASIEGGINYFTPIQYETNPGEDACGTSKIQDFSFNLMGKGSIPVSAFEVYAKAGAAITYNRESSDLHPETNKTCGKRKNTVTIRPAIGVGVGYDLTQSWVIDASINRALIGGTAKHIDYLAFGISYHFTDRYCGQFLC